MQKTFHFKNVKISPYYCAFSSVEDMCPWGKFELSFPHVCPCFLPIATSVSVICDSRYHWSVGMCTLGYLVSLS